MKERQYPVSKFTQQAIIDTFLKMLACKSLDKITVKEIVNECGINRNTFYYYYKDIYDLLEDVVSTESKKVIEEDGNSKTFYDECVRAFDVMMKYKNALLHIYNSRSRSVIEKYLMAVTPNFIRRFVTLNSENIEINEKNIIFILHMFYHFCFCRMQPFKERFCRSYHNAGNCNNCFQYEEYHRFFYI